MNEIQRRKKENNYLLWIAKIINEDVKNSYFGMMAIASNLDLSKYNLKLSAPIEKMVEQKQEQKVEKELDLETIFIDIPTGL